MAICTTTKEAARLIAMNTEGSRPDPGAPWPRGWRRLHVVILCFVVATIVAFVVQRVVPPPSTDLVLMCAIWITFYPVARLKRSEPWWAHWARGVVILFAFLLAQRFFR